VAGRPDPLGATWDGQGGQFALFSAHADKVELCLFDRSGQHEEGAHRPADPNTPTRCGTATCRPARPDQLYGYRVYGPYDPAAGPPVQSNKL